MPQGPDHLREKFMQSCPACGQTTDDGISTAEAIISSFGGTINRGFITIPAEWVDRDPDELRDAVQYLIEEWDYAIGPLPDRPTPPGSEDDTTHPPTATLPPITPLPPISPGVVIEKLKAAVTRLLEKFEHDVKPEEAGWDAIQAGRLALQYAGELERLIWPALPAKSNQPTSMDIPECVPPAPTAATSLKAAENPNAPSNAVSP